MIEEPNFWKQSQTQMIMFQAVKGLFAPGYTYDDLLNEARVGVWEASQSWDPAGGSKWTQYAHMIARRRVMDLVTLSRRRKCEPLLNFTELEVSGADNIPEYVAINDYKQVVHAMLKQIHMTALEKSVIELKLLDFTPTEIADKLGVNYKRIDNAYQRILRKLKTIKGET